VKLELDPAPIRPLESQHRMRRPAKLAGVHLDEPIRRFAVPPARTLAPPRPPRQPLLIEPQRSRRGANADHSSQRYRLIPELLGDRSPWTPVPPSPRLQSILRSGQLPVLLLCLRSLHFG